MTHLRTAGLLAGLSLFASAPQAAGDDPLTINVTAARTPQSNVDTLASVTVIDRDEIERRQAHSVQDALRGVPGLSFSNNGGLGKATSVFLRGAESDQVLVLVDGVRVGSATLGTTSIQDIPIDQVERIEVVRGPRSSLYGADAIGGVIQIFTRKGGGPLTPRLSLGGGSHGTQDYSAGLSGGGERGWFSVGASHLQTRGFNSCAGRPFPPGGGCFTDEPDHDGYRNTGVAARAGYRLTDTLSAEAHYLRGEGENEYDGSVFSSNSSDYTQDVFGARVDWRVLSGWQMSLSGGRSRDLADAFHDDSFRSTFNSNRYSASWLNVFTIGAAQRLTLGADWLDDRVSGTTDYGQDSRDNAAGFAQYQGQFGSHELTAAVRRDDNQQFGGHTTGSLAWGYRFSPTLRVMASWGSAFKAPTFNELYFPFFGNPSLEPEEADSYELGVAGQHGAVDWSLNLYQTDIDELIGFDASFVPVNIDKTRIRGLEAIASTRLAGWDLAANLSVLDPENRGQDANRGNQLPRRAKLLGRLDADRSLGAWRIGASLYGEGKRYDDIANTTELGGYVTFDLRATYALTRDWSLEGKLANALDKHYRTANLFNQDGRNAMLTVRYAPPAR
ncbi:MAG TPA: TonB-dependent vitamin B12 receptor [Gammaproteobacteria bacterium]|nr:TonB-dependent vitamin B12 receptor [Gammaproteobacteria bacterium]